MMTGTRATRRLWVLVLCAGIVLLIAAAAAAVIEGYASDAEARTGDPTLAIILGAVGLVFFIGGLLMQSLTPRRSGKSVDPPTGTR